MTRMAVVTMLDNAIASRPDRMCPGGGRGRHGDGPIVGRSLPETEPDW